MADGIYNNLKSDLLNGNIDLGSGGDTIKVALLDNTHSFSATDSVWSDVSANEISGTGYTAGGATLANQSISGTTTVKLDGDNVAWSSATFTAYHIVLYDTTNSNSLICSFDLGGAKTVASGTFTIQWNASGILTIA